jgi:hypothetical protein
MVVSVDPKNTMGVNNLSLGCIVDDEWKEFTRDTSCRELARGAQLKMIRIFGDCSSIPGPCTHWDETTKTGQFNWADIDMVLQRILEIGAAPLICLGDAASCSVPPGMAINPDTNLPYPESFAAYASEWVRHFKNSGLPVRFYEIWNEPQEYFGWEPVDFAKLANYMALFDQSARSMREQNADLSISFDFIARKPVLDYWLVNNGADVDALHFHKYGYWIAGGRSDSEELALAESQYFGQWPLGYSIEEARQVWLKARGKLLPMVNSESNFSSAWNGGTDPRIQQMVGAVWTALVLRMSVIKGVTHSLYYTFASSLSYGQSTKTGGPGFGMINADNNQPWYPYYVLRMIGDNLSPDDKLVNTTSSSEDVRTLGWIHRGQLNILLICKVDEQRTLQINGLAGQLNILKIDNTVPWQNASIQASVADPTKPLAINGYTVALLQGLVPKRRA